MNKLLILLLLSIPAWGQIGDYNVPRAGIGLQVCIGAGSNTMTGSTVQFGGSCIGLTTGVTTYGYLDASTGNLLTNTTGAPVGSCPIFEADTDLSKVTAVRDKRPSLCGASGGAIPSTTVGGLPSASANAGRLYRATDGTTSADCTTGGGSTSALCMSNGTTWVGISNGVPGGTNTQVQFNNSGVFGAISNVSAGSFLFSNGVSSTPTFQNTISVTNPQANSNANDRALFSFTTTTDSTTSTPGAFNNEDGIELTQNVLNGQALYSNSAGATRAKKTFLPFAITANFQGSGQKILSQTNANCYSMSDCAANSTTISYAGGPITGDEGQGFSVVSNLAQQGHLTTSGVSSTSATTCNTTTTQALTPLGTAQSFTVASTTGCHVNDWVVLGQEVATGSPQEAAMQITAVGVGTISGVVVGNFANSSTVTPATVMNLNTTDLSMGQDRMLVDLTAPSYSTGTVSGITGAAFTGSGTAWTTSIVGGNSTVIGCIELTPDDYNAAPFNGSGNQGTLHTWYPITGVSSNTALSILSWSVAQDAAYHGYGPGAGGYVIRPCAKVLRVISNSQLILENNSFTWSANDALEEAINAYPDVTAFQYDIGQWNSGGVRREFMNVTNNGARSFQIGINLTGQMPGASNADKIPFLTGFQSSASQIGFAAAMISTADITHMGLQVTLGGTSHGLVSFKIPGLGGSVGANPTTQALELNTITYNPSTVTQGSSQGSIVFGNTDFITGGSNTAEGVYVGRLDLSNFNGATETRLGFLGIQSNTWFIQPNFGTWGRSLQFFDNQNGGAQGTGTGLLLTIAPSGQLVFNQGEGLVGVEAAAPAANCAVASQDCLWPDSTAHRWKMQNNNGTVDVVGDTLLEDCGSTSTCSATQKPNPLIVRGSVAFPTATTVTVTALPFTSSSSYSCTAGDVTTAAGVVNATTYTSGSSVTFTETNGVNTDTMRYICAGF